MTKKVAKLIFDRPWYQPVAFGLVAVVLNFVLYYSFDAIGKDWADAYRNTRFVLDGLAVWLLSAYIGQAHRRRVRRRMEQLRFLNHNIRNALQIMVGFEYLDPATRDRIVRDSAERIIATVHEISDNEQIHLKELGDLTPVQARKVAV